VDRQRLIIDPKALADALKSMIGYLARYGSQDGATLKRQPQDDVYWLYSEVAAIVKAENDSSKGSG